jgi:hypothetical protein
MESVMICILLVKQLNKKQWVEPNYHGRVPTSI